MTKHFIQNAARMQNDRRNVMVNPQMQTIMRNSMMAHGNDMKKVAMNGNNRQM